MLLRRGDKGNGVAIVQHALNGVTALQPKLQPDGIFGPKTEQRVQQHQTRQRLKPDGIVGPLTLDSLFEIVKLAGTVRFRRNPEVRSVTPAGALRSLGPSRPPTFGPSLSPAMAEFMRHQQAFLNWFTQPTPKPPLPIQAVIVPVPGPFGPVFLPVAHQQIDVLGPPARQTAQVQFGTPIEGGSFTLSIQGETAADVAKRKLEAVYRVELEWAVFKGRFAEVAVAPSFTQNQEGKYSGQAEVSLTGGSGLTLKAKLSELGVLKFVPFLATALTTEGAVEVTGGLRLAATFTVAKIGNNALEVNIGIEGGPKVVFGPSELPDGREVQQVLAVPFAGTGIVGVGFSF